MGKQRRSRGPHSTWEPKPAPAENPAAAPESPTLEAPIPTASPAIEHSASEPADRPADPPALAVAVDAAATVSPPTPPVAMASLVPFAVAAAEAAEPALPDEPASTPPSAPSTTVRRAAGLPMAFAPERMDLVGIGATITGYMRGEGEAVAAHMRALGGARSPADLIRLQVGEVQRAADASLTCWSRVARKASRAFAYR